MKCFKMSIVAFLLLACNATHAQTVYTFSSYKLCGIDSAGSIVNCKDFQGTSLFEYFEIEYKNKIGYKFLDSDGQVNIARDNDAMGKTDDQTTIYKLIDKDTSPSGAVAHKKNHLIVFLVFDDGNQNKLLKVVYILTENDVSSMGTLEVKG